MDQPVPQTYDIRVIVRWRVMAQLWLAAVMLVLSAIGVPALAQGAAPHIRAGLSAETLTPAAGSTVDIAISMAPEAPWHGYWVNGGDAGFGMQVEWTLPPGVSIGELAYPVPETLVIGGLMNHVYERPYALIAPLTIAANVAPGTRLPISGEANWLACTDEVCVPERGTLTLTLVAGDGAIAGADRARFDGWRSALPQALNGPASYEISNGRLRIAVPLPASLALPRPHLFVATTRAHAAGGEQRFSRSGNSLIIDTVPGSDLTPTSGFSGLIRIDSGRGVTFIAKPGVVPPPESEPFATVPDAKSGVEPVAAGNGGDSVDAVADGEMSFSLLLTALGGAVIGGLLLNIMPCVFPILSLKALALARAGGEARHVRAEGFAYTGGAILTCLALGTILLLLRAGGEAVGWAFQLQRPESVLLLTILMAAITANLAGLFDFGSLSFQIGRARLADGEEASPAKTAFLTGALAAFVATPCSGPLLGAALGATLVLPAWASLVVFGGLGFGLALPFLLLALVPALRTRLPRPGAWMETMRRWLAVPMALTALALVWLLGRQTGTTGWLVGAAAVVLTLVLGWWAGRLQREGKPASMAFFIMAACIVPLSLLLPQLPAGTTAAATSVSDSLVDARPWSEAALAEARASGRPLFVYFTADWCVSCKVNEASSIERDETAEAFRLADVTVLKADWTNADPAITRELATHGRNSVPLYLWYPADGSEPELLPQILTPSLLVDRAKAATID